MILLYGGVQADQPVRESPRLTAAAETALARRLDSVLRDRRPKLALGALASGSDILIAESAIRCGVPLRIVLPYSVEIFRATSVISRGSRWLAAYDAIVENPAAIVVEGNRIPGGAEVYRDHNRTLADEAADCAVATDGRVALLAIRPAGGSSTGSVTDDLIALAADRGYPIIELDVDVDVDVDVD